LRDPRLHLPKLGHYPRQVGFDFTDYWKVYNQEGSCREHLEEEGLAAQAFEREPSKLSCCAA